VIKETSGGTSKKIAISCKASLLASVPRSITEGLISFPKLQRSANYWNLQGKKASTVATAFTVSIIGVFGIGFHRSKGLKLSSTSSWRMEG